jgi:UDP-N-acetylglucosamine:LPS N-acetylglucosamine transferase
MAVFNPLARGFTAGAVGGAANVAFLVAAGAAGIIAAMGITFHMPALPAFLYKQMVWGGIFGLLFAPSVLKGGWVLRGLIIGLAPSVVALFYFLPLAGVGMAGLNLGTMTPVLVLVANSVWGVVAAWVYDHSGK